ncbi:THG1 [Cyberlindnera jadinii]|uniref:tRNA(His) guanylyltransferase n=1 Tax=Cyberlindnera jadinii (strain ATCC 18201 / CBS 1600 / BCRC 20928 / JCM 3617 / NBRC 0987 / NRRL Y-1542) TaxID=983966 RepID=A0A0H5C6M9_CYBJN|nr:tRNAHis guanylyltransferase [Cyberlindnera jadinii NRRL Y-1542]ODV72011.1 tRNAHis guanylyltransferase [Cyberlindnera jadinii NRRL Y-1542]CEP23693.1 THG1 [Cyberlindnera jadinii]
MAKSRFEYVKQFERDNLLLPETFIVIRLDGRGFHKFTDHYNFVKPNDIRALKLANAAALNVTRQIKDVLVAFGESDEYSFILRKECDLFNRRESKLVSTFVSTYTAHYVQLWPKFFPNTPLEIKHMPTFDGRAVVYPNLQTVKDYLSWRYVDTHINNLYNTTFWNLVLKGGMTTKEAEQRLMGTLSSDKNEILFSEFQINYNNEPEIFKKGSLIFKGEVLHVDVYNTIDTYFNEYDS